jgi:hypothetical protein
MNASFWNLLLFTKLSELNSNSDHNLQKCLEDCLKCWKCLKNSEMYTLRVGSVHFLKLHLVLTLLQMSIKKNDQQYRQHFYSGVYCIKYSHKIRHFKTLSRHMNIGNWFFIAHISQYIINIWNYITIIPFIWSQKARIFIIKSIFQKLIFHKSLNCFIFHHFYPSFA